MLVNLGSFFLPTLVKFSRFLKIGFKSRKLKSNYTFRELRDLLIRRAKTHPRTSSTVVYAPFK